MSVIQAQDERAPARISLRHVMAVFVGNGLEFYDFLTFSYFAIYISRTFYPGGNPSTALLATLATFGAGFLTRPIGAIVIGGMGDRIGRKPAMVSALVLLFRLMQGFALGGEVGPTTAFMAEAAPLHRRGLYLSMQYATQDAAVLMAGIVGTTLAAVLSAQQLQDWGWRAAMLLGASIVPFGIAMRRTLPETLHRVGPEELPRPIASGARAAGRARPYLAIVVLGLMMLTAGTIGSYTLSYMTTYALDTLHLPATISFTLIIINGAFSMVVEPLSGWMSDKLGRKPVMIVPGVLLLLAILPCFWAIGHWKSPWALDGAEALLSVLASLSAVPVIVTITETLPPYIRSGAVATIYAFAISIFGGSTQFMIKLLIDRTGNPLAPAYYWTGALAVGLVAMALVRESAPVKRRVESPDAASPARASLAG
ncbi:MAG: MFS transporter [Candidatus Eisenbacteria bacterium]|uniref:MFS transporter n=1 Tax=Eiseniibacteriota bacterium TaxID=2212470 RepID=A0A538U2L2_UNCEI|nr:MAG: MFS transporter [Candidatus Eisenbacteria bacterium]